jgi:carboxyl-terminal processing protease
MNKRWKILSVTQWLLILSLVVVLNLTTAQDKKKSQAEEYHELMQVFVDTFEQVERNYVKDVDRRKLLEAALTGMVRELDPYSSYISPKELARFTQSVEQEFGGVGIQVQLDPRTRRILVISPLPDTPAYHAGVRAGDIVMEVEGEDTENMPLSRAVQLMKGPAGGEVTIKVRHLGETKIEEIKIKRAIITVSSVLGDHYHKDGKWEYMLDDKKKIGYIRLTQFGRQSADELTAALEGLKDAGMKGLILDLRFNPGGLLSQAVRISDMFIDSGIIVSTEGKNSRKREWRATRGGTYKDFPMVILLNRFSASASEIVSACLQDHSRAIIVGERSWGKGSVQNVIELESGASALKLTTAGYMRPSGKNIHRFPDSKPTDEWGVHPNEGQKIRFSNAELAAYDRYRRGRDVLSDKGPPKSDFKDRQLTRALEQLDAKLQGDKEEKKDDKEDDKKDKKDDKAKEAAKPDKPEAKKKDD